MVNRFSETSDFYHLIKVMKAEKDQRLFKKLDKKKKTGNQRSNSRNKVHESSE